MPFCVSLWLTSPLCLFVSLCVFLWLIPSLCFFAAIFMVAVLLSCPLPRAIDPSPMPYRPVRPSNPPGKRPIPRTNGVPPPYEGGHPPVRMGSPPRTKGSSPRTNGVPTPYERGKYPERTCFIAYLWGMVTVCQNAKVW